MLSKLCYGDPWYQLWIKALITNLWCFSTGMCLFEQFILQSILITIHSHKIAQYQLKSFRPSDSYTRQWDESPNDLSEPMNQCCFSINVTKKYILK